ncbi:MAG TPA: vWA domain-containing protein [Verrucomicrobiae bacterium]|nr:vWA domain-containing protein [Verrucomicrobiae bacterium]
MKIETILDHQTIFENRRPEALFLVQFVAPDAAGNLPPDPAAYCLVWDRSASIDEHEFATAHRFVTQFIRHLPANALFSLITFHEAADALVDLGPVTDKAGLLALLNETTQIDFGTNLSAALLLAKEQLNQAPEECAVRKIILLTDCEHTCGIRDEDLLEQIARGCNAQGIHISTIHFTNSNIALIDRISAQVYPHLRGENLLRIVESELGGLQPLAAQNVRVRLKPLDFCERVTPLGFVFSERSDGWLTYALGDMLAGEERTVCCNLTIPLLPCIDDKPCASLANEALVELEAGYEAITAEGVSPKVFRTTVRIPAMSNTTYPTSEDGSLSLRDGD